MPKPRADTEVRTEKLAAVFRETPLAVLVTMVNAGLMVAVLDGAVPLSDRVGWLGAVLAVSAGRLALWRGYRNDPDPARHVDRWDMATLLAASAAGLLWGCGAVLLWPPEESLQLFWVFLIGGMCAGAAVLHYAHLPTALAFILTAGLPIAWLFVSAGSNRGAAAAAMILVFLAALTATCRRSSALFSEYLLLRIDAAHHARALDAANTRLRQEMAEHRATEATLRQAQKMEALGQLTGGIAHDFNNLLMAVLGSLALLRKRLPAEDRRTARLLDIAVEGADRGAALTQRLLAFSRQQALTPQVIELPVLVRGLRDLLERSVGPAHTLQFCFPHDLAPVSVDGNQLELALLNLVLNARDALPMGGSIRIAAAERTLEPCANGPLQAGRYIVLSVTDTGVGMDPETLARATEPFFTTKGVGKGTGLGLPMVHGLAAQSGGRLVLRSTPGAGTVAELWLPEAEAPPATPAAPVAPVTTAEDASRPVLCVLVVDDDPLVLTSTAAMIEDLGYRALQAESGASALEELRAGAAVDLVITDHGMPGMTGLQLAGELRRLRPGLPVILATGYGDLPGAEAAGLPRLSKPFGQAMLDAAIQALPGVRAADTVRGDRQEAGGGGSEDRAAGHPGMACSGPAAGK